MSEHSFVILFVSIYVFISLIGVSSTEYVPVYMWETTQFAEVVPALERVSPESYKSTIIERVTKNAPVLLFAEQNLSPEDFALHDVDGKSPFTQLSALKNSAQISYWPFVKSPIKVIKELPERSIVETSIKSILSDHNCVLHNNEILIVDLNDAREGEDRVQMLKRHDKDIITIYKRCAEEHENIITFFTGHHSSWVISEELRSHRRARDTGTPEPKADENDTTSIIYSNPDIMIYVTSVPILSYNGTKVNLEDFSVTTDSKSDTEMKVTLGAATNKELNVKMDFNFTGGYWLLIGVVVHNESMPSNQPKDFDLRVKDVYAPDGFSYHCISQTFFNFDNANQNLTLPGLQMQAYLNATEDQVFGDAYDCVGFMSAPIWSGIFVTFILALIMTLGLTMMMDIKTMDRFDDPKGKTITISATE